MCRVELCCTVNPCTHRWYRLLQPCMTGATIQTCPARLAIEGWEVKCDFCPFCDGWNLSADEFMILSGSAIRHGSISSAASCSSDGYSPLSELSRFRGSPHGMQPLSRRGSLATSVSSARRISRSSSQNEADIYIPNDAGAVLSALERNAMMNARIYGYMDELPEDPSPTRTKSKSKKKKSSTHQPTEEDDYITPAVQDEKSWKRRSGSLTGLMRRRSKDVTGIFR